MEPRTPSLLETFKRGDEEAYGILFQRYRQPLSRYLYNHSSSELRRRVSVEDLLQETHVEALRSVHGFQYREQLSFFFWLCRIGQRRIFHHYRKASVQPPTLSQRVPATASVSSVELFDLMSGGAPNPERQLLMSENVHLLATALDELPDTYREAILLRRIEGWSTEEAAQRAGVSANAMKLRLSRGLRQLRATLSVLFGESSPINRG